MIYFIRHGATDWNDFIDSHGNKSPKCQGRADLELNSRGIKQAYDVSKELIGKNFDRVICSPLKRAKQTLEIIYNGSTEIEFDDRIIERDFGEYEGLTRGEFDFFDFWNLYSKQQYKLAETILDVEKRVFELLEELRESPDKDVLIVSHGGVGCILLSYFYGIPKDGNYLSFEVPNAKPIILSFTK